MIPQINSLSYISAFLAGIAASFSPCVYPLIPVTLGFIGAEAGSSRLRGLFLSLAYVLGLAVTYSVLGIIASLTGSIFGKLSMHPVSYLVMGNACILAGLSFFDVIHIRLPGIYLQDKIKKSAGLFSAFLFGMVSGLVISPCLVPVVGTILLYVSSKQNVIYGGTLLFVFAFGMGFLLILIGTFGALILNLSKSANWLMRIRKISGLILIAMGEYFIFKAGMLL